jgi:protein phosphatase
VAALLVAGAYAAYEWSQRQYYVAADGGKVAIFRGVSQDLGPIGLSHVEEQSDIAVADLPSDVQGSLDGSIPARDRADAEAKVETLRAEAERCRNLALAGTPCGDTEPPSGTSTDTPSLPTSPSATTTTPPVATTAAPTPTTAVAAR